MSKNLKSTPNGDLNAETTETLPASQSSSVESTPKPESQITSDTSATTAKAKSPKGSQPTPKLQDVPNAAHLIQALGAKLGALVEWKRLKLGNGEYVYALCFPTSKWEVDPSTKELKPR